MTDDHSPNSETDGAYRVLARKYRPQRFEDLIGHEAMVRTLNNAFASDRIAHAYILTGVRGVGKTTTARILARALNYVGPDGADNGPQMDMPEPGLHCAAIADSRHPDVLEMDAASRTGVNDIRELIEGVRYAPVEARYKVYIIDEVHMLSTAAFNALLKTLEEPPPHVKFIFATTEIRKLPVTVLSRCQRFDLRRIDPETLANHLASIAEKEGASVEAEGLAMIARAAEGSVRDALSILDQALVQHATQSGGTASTEPVTAFAVREMLGLADRTETWALLDATLNADAKAALERFRAQYDAGADPGVVLRDLLELVHLLTRVKAAGAGAAAHGPAGEADADRAVAMADALQMNALTRAWSLLMKGLTETQMAPDPAAAAEMALIRLCYAADLPTPDEALKALKKNSSDGVSASGYAPPVRPEPAPSAPIKAGAAMPDPKSFEEVAKLAGKMRDAKLRAEIETHMHLVTFAPQRIEVRLSQNAPEGLVGRLTQALKTWTGKRWMLSVNTEGQGEATLRDARMQETLDDPMVKAAMEIFPGAEITRISEIETPLTPADTEEDPPEDPELDAPLARTEDHTEDPEDKLQSQPPSETKKA
ncbi:MAG: DNA polymerase III subunit gamma/tau [Pseudomonadota bacterium]